MHFRLYQFVSHPYHGLKLYFSHNLYKKEHEEVIVISKNEQDRERTSNVQKKKKKKKMSVSRKWIHEIGCRHQFQRATLRLFRIWMKIERNNAKNNWKHYSFVKWEGPQKWHKQCLNTFHKIDVLTICLPISCNATEFACESATALTQWLSAHQQQQQSNPDDNKTDENKNIEESLIEMPPEKKEMFPNKKETSWKKDTTAHSYRIFLFSDWHGMWR